MNARFHNMVLNNPRTTLVMLFLAVIVACVGFKNLWLSTSFKINFDKTNPLLIAMNEQEDTFAKNDNMVVLVVAKDGNIFNRQALQAIDEITTLGWQSPFASRVDSLTNFNVVESEADNIIVEPVLESPATKSDAQLSKGKEAILNSPELKGYLVSQNGRSSIVLMTFQLPENPTVEIKQISDHVHKFIDQVAPKYPQVEFHVTGTVEASMSFTDAMLKDMALLLPIGYGLMVFALTFLLRSLWATVITLSLVTVVSVVVMGIKCWFDGAITAVNMFAPTMIMTIAIADCVHVLTSFLLHYRSGLSKKEAMMASLTESRKAVFLTSITTAVGFASLNFHESPTYRELGNLVVFGIGVAWFLVYVLLPALVMVLPIKAGKPQNGAKQFMTAWANWVIKYPKQILAVMAIVSVTIIAVGMPRNELNEMFTTYLDDTFEFKRSNTKLNQEMGGLHRLLYTLDSGKENGIYEPAYLQRLEAFAQWFRTQEGVSSVYTYTDVMKRLNRAMHNNDAQAYTLPDNVKLAAQYALVHEMSLSEGQELTNMVSMDKRKTMLTVIVAETDSKALLALNKNAEDWLAKNTDTTMQTKGVGLDLIFSNMAMTNIPSMVYGTFLCIAVVSIMIAVALKSWRFGLISMFANALPVAIALGLWGFINGRIDIGVAAVGTLSFGIVVDDTIHFMTHYQKFKQAGMATVDAIREVFVSSGLAMITTTVALIGGFGILAFSHYSANANMGFLTAICMFLAIVIDLFALPAWLVWRDNAGVKHD
jgi:predicted RND superfamily exporter protein